VLANAGYAGGPVLRGYVGLRSQPGSWHRLVTVRIRDLVTVRGDDWGRRVVRVQAIWTRRCWFAGLPNPRAWRASSLASRLQLSLAALVAPVSTAQMIWFSHLMMVVARLASSGMSSFWAHQSQKECSRPRTSRSQGIGPGDAGAQVQGVPEFVLRDPRGGDLLPVAVAVKGAGDLGELLAGEVQQAPPRP
jgi:hypothetical protein